MRIEQEFKDLCPPLAEDEQNTLEQSILEEGCRECLTLWQDLLLDGHNRLEICERHSLPFKTQQVDLPDRESALDWIIRNQLGRRNLTSEQASYLRGKQYNREKTNHGGKRSSHQSDDLKTKDRLASTHRVGAATIERDGKYAEALDRLPAETRQAILTRDLNLNRRQVKTLAGSTSQTALLAALESGLSFGEAIRDDLKAKQEQPSESLLEPPKLYQADARAWLKSLDPYDLLLTDPPFSTDVDDVEEFAESWLPVAMKKLKTTGRAFVFVGAYPDELQAYLEVCKRHDLPLKQVLVWHYKNTMGPQVKQDFFLNWQAILYLRGPDASPLRSELLEEKLSVFGYPHPARTINRLHEWQKPLELAELLVRLSTVEGQTVADPFCCTATFPLAAAKLNRRGLGADINMNNLQIAKGRGCRVMEANVSA